MTIPEDEDISDLVDVIRVDSDEDVLWKRLINLAEVAVGKPSAGNPDVINIEVVILRKRVVAGAEAKCDPGSNNIYRVIGRISSGRSAGHRGRRDVVRLSINSIDVKDFLTFLGGRKVSGIFLTRNWSRCFMLFSRVVISGSGNERNRGS